MDGRQDTVALLVGSVFVILGSSIAGIYSFQGREPIVFVGFCLFVLGYYIARDGRSLLRNARRLNQTDVSRRNHPFVRAILILVGAYGIARGVTLFSLTVLNPTVEGAVLAGIFSIGGYAWAHTVIHQSLL